jgi:hypothetical protein
MWSNDGGASWAEVNRPLGAGYMALEDGVTVTFAALTGHTQNDHWDFRVRPTPVGKEISAKGLGAVHPLAGGLLSNPIDVCLHFLKTWCNVADATFDDTAKQTAYIKCAQNAYSAGGVINEDCTPWDKCVEILSSFLGSIYINGQGKIIFSIDDNSIQMEPTIIQRHEAYLTDAKLKLSNLVNCVPFEYAYDYVQGSFWGSRDGSLNQDNASISMYGYRKPAETFKFYWCRDINVVETVLDIIVDKLANPIYQIELKDISMKRLAVDVGDWIVYSAMDLYDTEGLQMANRYWKVTGISPDFRAGTMTFLALETAYYLTEQNLADG